MEEIIESCSICVGGRIPCNPFVAVGDPADEILNAANQGYYDMIVLGSQGRSSLRGFFWGRCTPRSCTTPCSPS